MLAISDKKRLRTRSKGYTNIPSRNGPKAQMHILIRSDQRADSCMNDL